MFAHTAKPGVISPFHAGGGGGGAGGAGATAGCTHEPDWVLLALLELEDGTGPLYRVGVDKAQAEADLAGMLASIVSQE